MSTRAPVALPSDVPPRSRMRFAGGSERTNIMRLKCSDRPRPGNGVTDHHSPDAIATAASSWGVMVPFRRPSRKLSAPVASGSRARMSS